ncbi:MAG: hypothetical protein ABSC38_00285 [Verrucomicrobiia bacterium]
MTIKDYDVPLARGRLGEPSLPHDLRVPRKGFGVNFVVNLPLLLFEIDTRVGGADYFRQRTHIRGKLVTDEKPQNPRRLL